MKKCFVIQPFDNDTYDKRFEDVFKPAIEKANFEPYRVDKDLSVKVPIDEIEKGIRECRICLAEISTDNPNVWYELGFALACNKEVILICSSDERKGKFPFDIQHRSVITYKNSSKSDFEDLEEIITKKILAIESKSTTVDYLNSIPVVETEGLKSHEIALLILMMEDVYTHRNCISTYTLKNEMDKAGYTNLATSIAIKTLLKKNMIETDVESDHYNNGEEYVVCRLTNKGENWILSNQEQFQFRKSVNIQENSNALPF